MSPRVLIVSPVRNEAAHIERVVRAVAAQTLPPAEWVVIDDGSTDGTLALLRGLEAQVPFLAVHARPRDTEAVPDRLAIAAAPRAFNHGLRAARTKDFTHVAKLDGDVELPADYLEQLTRRFAADPGLGIACGDLVEPREHGMERLAIPPSHVHGALKCYTRACFEAIGGVQERLGWDTIDETYARMRGFRTASFRELVAVHLRPLASADGTLRGRARHGTCAYIAHFGAVWVALRAVKVAGSRPRVTSGLAFFYGYVRAAALRTEQVPDREFRRFVRRELRGRMVAALTQATAAPGRSWGNVRHRRTASP
jgi:glycosyltransferase involved in cell wall biosynthesis